MSTALVHSLEAGLVGVALLAVYTALTTPTVVCLVTLTVLYVIYRRERRKAAGTIPLTDKHVLITGCDSGFGLELAQHLHRRGCHVFATVLNPDSPGAKKLRDVSSPKLSVMSLDVSKDDDVSACLRRVKDVCDNTGLWGLVNNAGVNFLGDVELTTMSQYLRVADVNLFGMVRCTRAFLPLIRQAKGRIVNVTSIKGQVPGPLNAAYNITKYGGETFSDIVRLEMKEFGVKVVIIEPGNFGGATGCVNSEGIIRIKKDFDSMWDAASDEAKQLFKREHLDRVLAETKAAAGTSYPTVEPVLNTIEEALTSGDPEIRYIIDGSNRLLDDNCVGLVGVALLAVYTALTTPTVVCLVTLTVLYVIYRRERRKAAGTIPLTDKHVLITGCDSGFGLELAQHLHRRGCHVFATVLNPDSPGAKKLRDVSSTKLSVMPLDVSKDDDVSACLRKVKDVCDNTGLWGLVNNAGINFVGDVELTTMSQYLRVADVNLFGMVRCTRAFLPLIRQAKGRIVNVTSIKGLLPAPLNAAYNITKYGGETFSDIVRLEMKEFGVKVVIIEPGNFGGATGCINSEGMKRIRKDFDLMWDAASEEVKQMYSKIHLDRKLSKITRSANTTYPTVQPVMDTIEEALTSGDPELRYIVDGSNRLVDNICMLARVKPFLPDRIFDRLLLYFYPYKIENDTEI